MWPLVVVAVTPVLGHTADLVQGGEHVSIQHLGPEGAVEAFDVGVLGWLARLDMDQGDAMPLRPLLEGGTDELRTVVQAQPFRGAAQFHQLLQRTDDPRRGQAAVDFDLHRFTVEVVVDVEGPEAAPRPQRIGHEVRRPSAVGQLRQLQRLPDTIGQSALAATWQVELQSGIDPPRSGFSPVL